MNSTIDEPNNLDEPHFDEEATLLAARPVVPLDEVPETKRAKRPGGRVALTLAIVGGLLIGLLAAALIFRYLNIGEPAGTTTASERPAEVAEQPSVQPPSPAGGAVASVDAGDESIPEEKPVEEKPEPKPEESRRVETPVRPSQVEPRRPVIVRDTSRRTNDQDDEEEDGATRRAQRQEERREQRRAIREARRQERQQRATSDDLTRIREIFEGTPKP